MGRYVVIGLGKFGTAVARALEELGHEVIAIERDGELVDRLADCASRVVAGDATDPAVLRAAGASDVDAAIISTAENLASTILATVALRDLGVANIYVKAGSEIEARALAALGVTMAVIPEQEAGVRLAHRVALRAEHAYLRIAAGHCVVETPVPRAWRGKSLRQLQPREKGQVSVIAVLDVQHEKVVLPPDPDALLQAEETILVAGSDAAIAALQEDA
jgi:trk system potassium uptake protein